MSLTNEQRKLIQSLDIVKASTRSRTKYNAYQQMLTRIRRFGHAAIEDLLYLSEELPDDEIRKILPDSRIETLVRVIERALKASGKIPQDSTLSLKISAELAADYSKQPTEASQCRSNTKNS